MWKRILPFVLALTIVFSLCACNRQGININQSIQEGTEKLSSVENCCLVLRITINPQLEVYLDAEGTVLKAEAGNKDGESLLAVLELTGLSYEDAVTAVLSTAAAQNFLPEGATVQIEVLASADGPLSLDQTRQLEQVVTDYNAGLVAITDQNVVIAEDCGADLVQVENLENGDIFYSYFSNMECVREVCYSADGSYHEWIYENKQNVYTLTVHADGTRYEEHCSYEGSQLIYHSQLSPHGLEETTYYSDGTQQSHKMVQTDGSFEEQEFYSNGNPKIHKIVWSDNSFGESHYDENGAMTYSYERTDGTSQERYYYANGNIKTSLVTYPDGSIQERQYYENGNVKFSRDVFPDGSVREEHCDESGQPIENN